MWWKVLNLSTTSVLDRTYEFGSKTWSHPEKVYFSDQYWNVYNLQHIVVAEHKIAFIKQWKAWWQKRQQ